MTSADPSNTAGVAQTLSDREQTIADGDQTSSDLDQTRSDADQTASERDQVASDRDQEAADRDQATAESDKAGGMAGARYAQSRRARSQSASERDMTSQVRSETARMRDENAARRDRAADERDAAARARDQLAETLDAEIERTQVAAGRKNGRPVLGIDVLMRAASDRRQAGASRARAAAQREAAARDRERAADDRRLAGLDRDSSAEDLVLEGIDYLTGALRRGVAVGAIQREMDRTRRTGEPLVVAFVDVDGLKAVNDMHDHAAGDELLREVARSIRGHVRSSDVLARFGGDEFVCSLSGLNASAARGRFGRISERLMAAATPTTITVGLAERREDDTVEDLIQRADVAMIEARRK